jgi:DNA-binding MurR/RpiR family transcriptional regulator
MSHHLVSSQINQYFSPFEKGDGIPNIMRKLRNNCMQMLSGIFQLISPHVIEKAANTIYNSKSLSIYSPNSARGSSLFAQRMFLQIGIQTYTYSDLMFSIPASEHLGPRDAVLGISFSGMSKVVIDSVRNAKRKKAVIIGMTGFQNSELAKLSDILICYNSRIPDDLRYLHMIFILEITAIGMIQNTILSKHYEELMPYIQKTIDTTKLVRY